MAVGYRLTFEQLKSCLSDCRELKTINWVHFSGGEPTLWKEGDLTLVDLLVEISSAGFKPGFTTNGSYFLDYNKCSEVFKKYFETSKKPLRLFISIHTFHKNFDLEKGRAEALDNVLKCKNELPDELKNLLHITVLVTISKETKSLLPDEMITYYESLDVTFSFYPLKAAGKAKAFGHLAPNLDVDDLAELGAYYKFYKMKKNQTFKNNIVLIDNNYYFPETWRKVGRLGNLPKNITGIYR
jgi:MoaA/NifB/PqqE/SkfB family radical SAM enzyme